MGLVVLFACIVAVILAIDSRYNKRYQRYPSRFQNDISEDEFKKIVIRAAKRIRRLTVLSIDGPLVYCRVLTQSGINVWDFELNYDDHGHITGKYRFIRVGNNAKNVSIHISFAELIRSDIEEYYHAKG